MKKLLCILTLSFASFGHAETTQVNIQSAAMPQGMTQAQYQDLLINKKVEYIKAKAEAKADHEEAKRKAEIHTNTKRDFTNKIHAAWRMPAGSTGQKASARITLSDSGQVTSVVVNSTDPDVKASVADAIRAAAPFPMPSDPEVRKLVRNVTANFTVK